MFFRLHFGYSKSFLSFLRFFCLQHEHSRTQNSCGSFDIDISFLNIEEFYLPEINHIYITYTLYTSVITYIKCLKLLLNKFNLFLWFSQI